MVGVGGVGGFVNTLVLDDEVLDPFTNTLVLGDGVDVVGVGFGGLILVGVGVVFVVVGVGLVGGGVLVVVGGFFVDPLLYPNLIYPLPDKP